MKKIKCFTADFETSTPEWYKIDGYARVWAYAICPIEENPEDLIYGNNIDDFMKWCSDPKHNYTLYFHNLKFDGEYIFYWLLSNGYECIEDKKQKKDKTFTCLLADTGQFYSIEIYFSVGKKTNKITIIDSLKILNFSVEKIAKDFKLPINKLELDYKTYREVGHILTEHEINYIRNDVEIMARALNIMFNKGLTKMTIGSDALNWYKENLKSFNRYYPNIGEKDELIRKSYRGGWTYLNPLYKEKEVGEGIVIDMNSMYPSKMYTKALPFGQPIFYDGQYEEDIVYPLYIQMLSCSFKVKEGKLPTVQLKHTIGYLDNEYVETTDGKIETLCLTSVDLDLFMEHYDVENLVYHCGFKFKKISGLFNSYIDHWMNEKIEAGKEGNGARRQIAKLMLNSLYGKFGLSGSVRGKYPELEENGVIKYHCYDRKERDTIYVPVASFITSYAREDIIKNSQAIRDYTLKTYGKDYYIYSDTDSIHCLKLSDEELSKIIPIDEYELNHYKKESTFEKAKFIRQKCYVEVGYDGKVNSTIAGMPKKLGKYVNIENFTKGFSIKASDVNYEDHKLTFRHVKGGVLLVETDFTIK